MFKLYFIFIPGRRSSLTQGSSAVHLPRSSSVLASLCVRVREGSKIAHHISLSLVKQVTSRREKQQENRTEGKKLTLNQTKRDRAVNYGQSLSI